MRRLHSIKQERPNISEEHQLMMHGLFHDLKLSKFRIEEGVLFVEEKHGDVYRWTNLGASSMSSTWVRYGNMYINNGYPIDMSKFNIEVM